MVHKNYQKPDFARALYTIYLAMSQIMAAKVSTFDLAVISVFAPTAVLIFPFTFQITDIVNEAFGRKETHRMILIAFLTQVLMTPFL